MSMKNNSNDTIGNRSRDFPVCSAVSQQLRLRVPPFSLYYFKLLVFINEIESVYCAVQAGSLNEADYVSPSAVIKQDVQYPAIVIVYLSQILVTYFILVNVDILLLTL
jgi:hypothetical protein